MSDELPQPSVDRLCVKANAWKKPLPWAVLALSFGLILTSGIAIYLWRNEIREAAAPATIVQAPAPQPHSVFAFDESIGGKNETHGKADPSTVKLSGEHVEASDLKLTATVMDFDGLGRITGGGFGGSFKVSASNLRLLVWACIILGLIQAVSGTFKYVAKDYIHAVGQWLSAVGFIVGAANPEILGWMLVFSTAASMIAHAFPSMAAKAGAAAEATLGKVFDRLDLINPLAAQQATAALPDTSKLTLAKARAKRAKS